MTSDPSNGNRMSGNVKFFNSSIDQTPQNPVFLMEGGMLKFSKSQKIDIGKYLPFSASFATISEASETTHSWASRSLVPFH